MWTFVALVFVRGIADILSRDVSPAHPVQRGERADDTARVFAVTVARAYLAGSPALRRYLPPPPATDAQPTRGRLRVVAATVAGERRVSQARWLITVGCELAGGLEPRYVAVPIERDGRGRVAMFAPAAIVSGPTAVRAQADELAPIDGRGDAAVERLVDRFLAGYLSGRRAQLGYLTAPGAHIAPVSGLELLDVDRVGQASEQTAARRVVVAEVQARDSATGATYPLAYRLELVRRDRWYVAAVQGALS